METTKYLEKEFLSEDEIIDRSIKTRTINNIAEKIKDLNTRTTDPQLIAMLGSLSNLLKDAYVIDMYKFQFKIFTLAIQKEISAIQEVISAEV